MKKLVLAFAASAALVGQASAADMAVKARPMAAPVAVYNWTGFYIGLHAGADYRQDSFDFVLDPGSHLGAAANVAAVNAAGNVGFNRTGFIGGGQIGYNWQAPGSRVVFGVEADASWVDKSSRTVVGILPTTGDTFRIVNSNNMNWLATFRGRLGVAVAPTSLLYVTGGIAVADLRVASAYNDTLFAAAGVGSVSDDVRVGAAVGAGWEYAFSPNWSMKLEYLYTWFDRVGSNYTVVSTTGGTNAVRFSDQVSDHIGRVGINYRFGGPVVAKY
jgi:outer membrane immunogenic protein